MSQIYVGAGVKTSDLNISHQNNLHFCVVYSLRTWCVKAFTLQLLNGLTSLNVTQKLTIQLCSGFQLLLDLSKTLYLLSTNRFIIYPKVYPATELVLRKLMSIISWKKSN